MPACTARRILRSFLLVLGITVLAGCAGTDPRFEPAPLTQYPAGISIHKIWSTSIGSGSGFGFVPVVVGDSAYAATPDGDVAKVDLGSGKTQRQASVDMDLDRKSVVQGKGVSVSLDLGGRLLNKKQTNNNN